MPRFFELLLKAIGIDGRDCRRVIEVREVRHLVVDAPTWCGRRRAPCLDVEPREKAFELERLGPKISGEYRGVDGHVGGAG